MALPTPQNPICKPKHWRHCRLTFNQKSRACGQVLFSPRGAQEEKVFQKPSFDLGCTANPVPGSAAKDLEDSIIHHTEILAWSLRKPIPISIRRATVGYPVTT